MHYSSIDREVVRTVVVKNFKYLCGYDFEHVYQTQSEQINKLSFRLVADGVILYRFQ